MTEAEIRAYAIDLAPIAAKVADSARAVIALLAILDAERAGERTGFASRERERDEAIAEGTRLSREVREMEAHADQWRHMAKQRWLLRSEIEAALGISEDAPLDAGLAAIESLRRERDAALARGIKIGVEAAVEHWRIDTAGGDEIDNVCATLLDLSKRGTT